MAFFKISKSIYYSILITLQKYSKAYYTRSVIGSLIGHRSPKFSSFIADVNGNAAYCTDLINERFHERAMPNPRSNAGEFTERMPIWKAMPSGVLYQLDLS